jgi:anti-sigma-K factor RskA
MTEAEHQALREATGLYALGALDGEERAQLEAHLASCDECSAEVRALRDVTDALPFAVAAAEPPVSLRQRVLAAAVSTKAGAVVPFASRPVKVADTSATERAPRPSSFWAGWVAAAAMLLLAAAAGVYAANLKVQMDDVQLRLVDAVMKLQVSEQQLAEAGEQVRAVRANLTLLTAPDVVDLRLSGKAPAADASARAFVSRSRGLLFAASKLPALPADRTYQLWYLTRGAPVSAGIVRPDEQGNVTAAFDVPADVQTPVGFAVSVEPDGGVPAPTGPILLATQ